MAEIHRTLVDRTCEHCKLDFQARKDRKGKFCSKSCGAKARRVWTNDKTKNRAYQLKRLYGLTLTEFDELVKSQNGCCAVCENPLIIGGVNGAHVDHNHETGTVRGILCANCNHGLGKFKDDVGSLKRAIAYLTGA